MLYIVIVIFIIDMLRQIHTFLGLTKLEPKKVIQNRIHLQVKQK